MEEVISNDDLLTKILLCLQIKSLLRFKSVSKHWRSIITDARFAALHNPDHTCVTGLLCHRSSCFGLTRWNEWSDNYNIGLDFIPLDNDKIPTDISYLGSITRIPNLSGIKILNSCNELVLCLGYNEADEIGGYHVLNPSTKQFDTLPDPPNLDCIDSIGLAYDPSKSSHFKVVSISSGDGMVYDSYKIEIYSSETKTWRASSKRFMTNDTGMYHSGGVYWNGAINWFSTNPMYVNIDEERVGFMPMFPNQTNNPIYQGHYYFGESKGHLHYVHFFNPITQYDVYEMKEDYSEWFVKYHVDLNAMVTEFPEMIVPGESCHCSYSIISIIREKNNDEGSFMVLHVRGKFISYKFVDKSYKIIYEYEGNALPDQESHLFRAHPYVESLSKVPCSWKPSSQGEKRPGRSRASSSYRSRRGRTITSGETRNGI